MCWWNFWTVGAIRRRWMSVLGVLCVLGILGMDVVEARADIRQAFTILNSRGRPRLSGTLIAKLHSDSTIVDTASHIGGGAYVFQVDPDSGWTPDTYDLYYRGALLPQFTAVRIGVPASIDSTYIVPGGLSYTDINIAGRIDSADVAAGVIDSVHLEDGAIPWIKMEMDTLKTTFRARWDSTASSPKGMMLAVTNDGIDLGGVGGYVLKVVNTHGQISGFVVEGDMPATKIFYAKTGRVQIGPSTPLGASALLCYNETTFYDSVHICNPPISPTLGAAPFQRWAGRDSILTGQDSCLVDFYSFAPDGDDVLIVTPRANLNMWIDSREAWGFRVRTAAGVGANTAFDWVWIRKDN